MPNDTDPKVYEAISLSQKRRLISQGIPKERIIMMPNDIDHKIRVVAEWAGLWKQGQKRACDRIGGCLKVTCDDPYHSCLCDTYHAIPPPNLLEPAGAWALLVALRKQKYNIVVDGTLSRVQIWRDGMHGSVITTIRDDKDAEAVFYAAYQLATKEQQ